MFFIKPLHQIELIHILCIIATIDEFFNDNATLHGIAEPAALVNAQAKWTLPAVDKGAYLCLYDRLLSY